MKIQVKSGEIPIWKTLEKIMQNVDSRRLKPKLNPKVYLLSNTQNSIVINTEKIWRYQKQV